MKFLEAFVLSNFRVIDSQFFISRNALDFLNGSTVKVSSRALHQGHFIALRDVPEELKKSIGLSRNDHVHVKGILYRQFRGNHCFDEYLRSEFQIELSQSITEYRKYFYDFRSYRLSESESQEKAITLCLMKVIKYFLERYNNPLLLYQVFKEFKVKGEIPCGSAREFYKHIQWLIRRGVFQGILFGKSQSEY